MIEQTSDIAATPMLPSAAVNTPPAEVVATTETTAAPAQPQRARWVIWTGIGFFIFSCLSYLSLLLLPLLHVSNATKGILFVVLVGCGEGAFWLSAAFVGTAMVRRYRKYLNPRNWRRSAATSAGK